MVHRSDGGSSFRGAEMIAAAIRQCGTVCEAAYFDQPQQIDEPEEFDRSPITDDQRRFAKRSEDHLALAAFMGPMTREKLVPVAVTLRMGLPGDHLPYPRDFVVRKLRTLSEDEQAEAWELFGKGVEP